jgi:hypothetical protein
MREDLAMFDDMLKAGFKPSFSMLDNLHGRQYPNKIPNDAISFEKGSLRVWRVELGWQVAESFEGRMINHRGLRYEVNTTRFKGDRFTHGFGFIPDLKTVIDLDKNNDL